MRSSGARSARPRRGYIFLRQLYLFHLRTVRRRKRKFKLSAAETSGDAAGAATWPPKPSRPPAGISEEDWRDWGWQMRHPNRTADPPRG
ncbi:MAG: hypothetical protein ACKVIW_09645, partial [bacterium]